MTHRYRIAPKCLPSARFGFPKFAEIDERLYDDSRASNRLGYPSLNELVSHFTEAECERKENHVLIAQYLSLLDQSYGVSELYSRVNVQILTRKYGIP